MKKERKVKYWGFSLPKGLVDDVKEIVEVDERYTSVTDFVKTAIRAKMDEEKREMQREEKEK